MSKTSTIGRSFARTLGMFSEFDDHQVIAANEREIARALAKAARKGEYKSIELTEDEEDVLKVNRAAFQAMINDKEDMAAVFPCSVDFAERLQVLKDQETINMLKADSVKVVLGDLRRELARMARHAPVRDGEDVVERTRTAMSTVLARYEISTTNPQGVLALAVWSKIDPASPVADKLAERALARANKALADAVKREELNLVSFAVNAVSARRQANVQQMEMRARREALNPGLHRGGLIERIARSVARGIAGDNKPASWSKSRNGFRQTVAEAAAAE